MILHVALAFILIFFTDKPGPPLGPFAITGMAETSFILGWNPPEYDGGLPILEYNIEKREVGKKAWQKVETIEANKTNVQVTGMKKNISYHFRVSARNEMGWSSPLSPDESITVGKRFSEFKSYKTIF